MAIFIHCNKEECPAAALPTTATLLLRCHHRCREASAVLPPSPLRCCHLRSRAVANATVAALTPQPRFRCRRCLCFYCHCSRCRRCPVAIAALSLPPFCRAAATALPPMDAAKPPPRAVASTTFVFIVVIAAATALSRCQCQVVGRGPF